MITIQVSNFRSQFQNTKFKIVKTSSSISSFGKSSPNSKSSNFRSSSKFRSRLEFSFSSSTPFCFDESNFNTLPPYACLFSGLKFQVSISYLNLKSPNSGPDFSIFFLFSLVAIYTILHTRLRSSLALLRSQKFRSQLFHFPLHPFFVLCILGVDYSFAASFEVSKFRS